MAKRYLPAAIIFLLGMIITIIGAAFKLMHWPGGSFFLLIGLLTEALSVGVLIITLIINSRK